MGGERDGEDLVFAIPVVVAIAAADNARVVRSRGLVRRDRRAVSGGDDQRCYARRSRSIALCPDGVYATVVGGHDLVIGLRSVNMLLREFVCGFGGRLLGGFPERHRIWVSDVGDNGDVAHDWRRPFRPHSAT